MKKYKNLRVRTKLFLGFGAVLVLALALDATAIISVKKINDSYSYLLDFPKTNSEYLMRVDKYCSDMRYATTAIILNAHDTELAGNYWERFEHAYNDAISYADLYMGNNNIETIRDSSVLSQNNEIMQNIKSQLEAYRANAQLAMEATRSNADFDVINSIFLNGAPIINEATNTVGELISVANSYVNDASKANTRDKYAAIWTFAILSTAIFIIAVMSALFVSALISEPLSVMSVFLRGAGETGDVTITAEGQKQIHKLSAQTDEIGQISNSLAKFVMRITDVSHALEAMANGNLSLDFSLQSEKDVLGVSLTKVADDLSAILGELRAASEQVSAGASQISQSSQSLATGSSEQAAAIEDFSSSIAKLLAQTNQNAENSEKAQLANGETSSKLEDSIDSMVNMIDAMKAIDDSSRSITQIIKVIDDIAFQTNILALNAAVEAARAGQHGKGFAVVADEVRNLAAKSAQAAKETAALIESSSARVQVGNQIAERTHADLGVAIECAKESTKLIETVASASAEQAMAIFAISQSVDEISSVVQANSALSEQSAASAQEMSAQSIMLHQIVDGFNLKDNGLYIGRGATFQDSQDYAADKDRFSLNHGKY